MTCKPIQAERAPVVLVEEVEEPIINFAGHPIRVLVVREENGRCFMYAITPDNEEAVLRRSGLPNMEALVGRRLDLATWDLLEG